MTKETLTECLKLVKVDIDDKPQFDKYLGVLYSTMPHEEIISNQEFERFKNCGACPYFVYSNDCIVGLTYVFEHDVIIYVCYLAVVSEYQNKGMGSAILRELKQLYHNKPLVLSIESLDNSNPQTIKRYNFYRKNGFEFQHLSYVWQGVNLSLLADQTIDKFAYKEHFGKIFDYYNYVED